MLRDPLPTRYVRDEFPKSSFPLTLKNFNSKREVDGWKHNQKKLELLINTAVSAIDMTEPRTRIRQREDVERKKRIALESGAGDPDDIRPGEYGLSFAQKEHWRGHLLQLKELCDTAPLRVDATIDHHVQRIWNLNRAKGLKDIEKTRGMKNDFALTLKRGASRQQLLSWDCAITQLEELVETATGKIDNDWGPRGPPRSVKGGGTKKLPSASVASRGGTRGGGSARRERVGKSGGSGGREGKERREGREGSKQRSRLPGLRSSQSDGRLRSVGRLRGTELRRALIPKAKRNQISVAHVENLEHTEGLGLSMSYFLGGRAAIKQMTRVDVEKRREESAEERRRG